MPHTAVQLAAELDAALGLFKDFSPVRQTVEGGVQAAATLLNQCMMLCAQKQSIRPEPIRTLHHFACTGGTLISKCVAAMPNTQLLSEVDPLSTLHHRPEQPQFAPSDTVKLMRQSTRGVSDELIIELFCNNLKIIYKESVKIGQRLVLRDHAHSHFCNGADIPARLTLREMLVPQFPVLSLVTVRHPLDSYLSLKVNGFVHFSPPTFDEYCRRYLAFLQAYQDVPVVKFDAFVKSPRETMSNICSVLDIPYDDKFVDLFSVNKLTGDSGRSGGVIEQRTRRPVDDGLAAEISQSVNYGTLKGILKYE